LLLSHDSSRCLIQGIPNSRSYHHTGQANSFTSQESSYTASQSRPTPRFHDPTSQANSSGILSLSRSITTSQFQPTPRSYNPTSPANSGSILSSSSSIMTSLYSSTNVISPEYRHQIDPTANSGTLSVIYAVSPLLTPVTRCTKFQTYRSTIHSL
jgi:hypothetical protein